jgi:non-specific serine/threonine protein kinase
MSPTETLEYALAPEEGTSRSSPTVPAEPPSDNALDNLTRREWEVAALVARGFTNRQIASELAISEHTVATHVGKTRRKLGLSSRSQLAAWVVEPQRPASSGSH